MLLFQHAFATLQVLYPQELIKSLNGSSIPYQILLSGKPPYNSVNEFTLVTPSEGTGCTEDTTEFPNNSVLLLSKGNCPFSTKMLIAEQSNCLLYTSDAADE